MSDGTEQRMSVREWLSGGVAFQPKPILIIIQRCIAVSIGFAVLVFEGIGHIAIFVVTRHIIGADANAVGIHGQHGIPAGQGEGQLAGGGKTAKNHIQRRGAVPKIRK